MKCGVYIPNRMIKRIEKVVKWQESYILSERR